MYKRQIQNQESGLTFAHQEFEECIAEFIERFKKTPEFVNEMRLKAKHNLDNHWSTDAAAARLLQHAKALLSNQNAESLYEDGPCSIAD